MNKVFNKVLTGAIFLGVGLFSAYDAAAQNFEMNGAGSQYNATCGAVIRMKGTTSSFQNISGATLGTSGNVIEGVVDWAATTNGQTVQGLYYDHMVISGGGTKTVANGVFIVAGACPDFLTGYNDLATYPFYVASGAGNNTFQNTFNYVGTVPQTIFPLYTMGGSQPNNFDSLSLAGGGTKTVPDGLDVGVNDALLLASGTELAVSGNLYLGAQPSILDGTLTIDNGGTLNIGTATLALNDDITINDGSIISDNGDGDVTVGTGANLNLAGNTSILDFDDNTELIITGTIENNGNGTNLLFACNSTVTYNGTAGQLVLPTTSANSYGNLVLTNGAKGAGTEAYSNDFYLCNDFTLNGGGNFDLQASVPAGGVLYLKDEAAVVTYGTNEEVVGKMNRVTSGTPSAAYVFNNAQTVITLSNDADNATNIQLNVRPSTNPYNYNGTKDVNRKINMTYTGNSGEFAWTARAGYLEAEGPSAGTWPGLYTQASVRFYEADGTVTPDEKIGTGNPYVRNSASGANLGYVELAGISETATTNIPNGIADFASTNDLKLTAGPTTFYTVNDGRWTNPGTWDEGTRPSASDNTEIRHMVYVGIDGPFAGTTGGTDEIEGNNTLREATAYSGGVAAANTITIATGFANASLIIGNEDNGSGYVFHTASTSVGSFVNNNTNALSATFPAVDGKGSVTKGSLNGLWMVYNTSNGWVNSGMQIPTFKTFNILNLGSINNEGIIEVGE
ncbi:MAG TPA: hypothetical protein PLE30_10025 [Candidatus Kapabacteria bacterium]|nr:hypothetical protein [Candidatus Kapabacteria bacterium]